MVFDCQGCFAYQGLCFMSPQERDELVEQIAQAVIEKLDRRERLNRLADLVIAEILKLQEQHKAGDSARADEIEKKERLWNTN